MVSATQPSLYSIIKDILLESLQVENAKSNKPAKDLEPEKIIAFARPVILYVIGASTAYQCQRELKDFIKTDESSAQKFRLKLGGLSYVHLNLKFFTLNMVKAVSPTNRTVDSWLDAFSIHRNDAILIKRVCATRGFKTLAKKALAGLDKTDYDANAFKHVNDVFMDIYPEIYKHIRNRTYMKLRFLSMSENTEFHDFNMDLMLKALQTYNKLVPTKKSPLYIANYIRTSINNHVTNTIKGGTAQKRARMTKGEADGFGGNKFDILTVSENQLFHALGVEDTVSYENLRDSSVNFEEEYRNLSDLNYERILRTFGTTVKRRTLIELIACTENSKFTKWLKKKNHIKPHEDNVDFNDRIGFDLYLKSVCEFLELGEQRVKNFIAHIGVQAYPDRKQL